MAQRFIDEATQQLAPIYDQQVQAQQAQIPAIQQLYGTLLQGLEGTRKTETQNILESASARGVLRSTQPVDAQTALGAAILQQQGQYGAQQAKEIAGIQSNIGQINLAKATGIQQLADTLYNRDLEERKFQMAQEQARQEAAARAAAARSSGSGRAPTAGEVLRGAAQSLAGEMRKLAGRDGYVSPQTYAAARQEWGAAGFGDFDKYFGGFKNPQNKNYKYF